jgi:hypothetical protein
MHVAYTYGPRGDLPAVELTWYQGEDRPERWTRGEIPKWDSGVLFVGSKGMLLADYGKYKLLPEKEFADYKAPEPFLTRPSSHHAEWIDACKTGSPTASNFDYAGHLTEANHLGNVAYRTGKPLEWDPARLEAPNATEAERFLRREYRKGWTLA